jgi:error-prone DNA polymerase
MATFRHMGTIQTFEREMIEGMVANGYERDFAVRCFNQIRGFGEYGFPESHAASFALLVYDSAWVKCHYPDVFAAALLNSQPMGFYAPAQIVRDAQEHGVEVRPPDVNRSGWDSTLEPDGAVAAGHLHPRHQGMRGDVRTNCAVRLGFRQVDGFKEEVARRIVACRGAGYDSLRDLWLRTGLTPSELERLAEADAFGSLGLSRRDALWAVTALRRAGDKDDLPLFAAAALREEAGEPDVALRPMPPGSEVVEDYRTLHLSLKAHPVSFLRGTLDRRGITPAIRLPAIKAGRLVKVAGLVLVRQRPGSAKGVIFMTLEDEGGIANIIVWPKAFEAFRPIVLGARLVAVEGRLQSESGVIHTVADRIEDLSPLLSQLSEDGSGVAALARADEVARPVPEDRARRVMPGGRNFH